MPEQLDLSSQSGNIEQDANQRRLELRKFSKKNCPEDRQQTAGEIKKNRSEYFRSKKDLATNKEKTDKDYKKNKEELRKLERSISLQENLLEQNKSSLIKSLLNYSKNKRLEESITENAKSLKLLMERLQAIEQILFDFEQQQEDKYKLEESKKIFKDFYQNQDEKNQIFQKEEQENYEKTREEEKETRDITNIMEKYQVVFIHAINMYPGGANNPLVKQDITWQEKIKILLALNPTVSTSTIKQGDDYKKFFMKFGLILSKGSVIDASPGDMASTVKNLKTRDYSFRQDRNTPDSISEKIKTSISDRNERYNEFTVKDPEFVGFFVCMDYPDYISRWEEFSKEIAGNLKIIFEEAENSGLPVYAFMPRGIFKVEYPIDPIKQLIDKIPFEKFIQTVQDSPTLKETQTRQLIDELLATPPFNLAKIDEIHRINGFREGEELFIQTMSLNLTKDDTDSIDGDYLPYQEGEKVSGELPLKNDRFKTVSSFYDSNGQYIQFIVNEAGQIYKRMESKRENGTRYVKLNNHSLLIQLGDRTINLIDEVEDKSMITPELCLSKIKSLFNNALNKRNVIIDLINQTREDIKAKKLQNARKDAKRCNTALNNLAYILYGFAKQAEFFGNSKIAIEAKEMANSIVPMQEFQTLIKKRLDNEGRLKVTLEDINNL